MSTSSAPTPPTTTPREPTSDAPTSSPGGRRLLSAFAGFAAGAAALGAGEFTAAVLHPAASPVLSVGSFVIDLTPAWLKASVIAVFGTGDKTFLLTVLVVVVVIASFVAGILEVRRPPAGRMIVAAFGVVAAGAAVTRTGNGIVDAAPSLVTLLVGVLVLGALATRIRGVDLGTNQGTTTRRKFLTAAGIWTGAGAVAALTATVLTHSSRQVASAITQIKLPRPSVTVPPVPAAAELHVPGIAPLITPNDDFYRIDISLSPPSIDPSTWSLAITGLVEQEVHVSYKELLALPLQESRTTLMCVSNEVGGNLISTATWLGYPIRELLARAKPKSNADMVLSSGADGFTASTPLSVLTDPRNAIFAVAMNGSVLPQVHGFPVRMVVPGLYGYVSGTKWVTQLEVTRFDRAASYWTQRGWSPMGPVKLSSRIDVPTGQASVAAGVVMVAGEAWAQHVGVTRVQVQVDGEPWRDATLADELTIDVWRQWSFRWMAVKGTHQIRVRATNAKGLVQTSAIEDVIPNGATGLHTVQVTVA